MTKMTEEQLMRIMDEYLEVEVAYHRDSTQPARAMAMRTAAQQRFVLHWGQVLATSACSELAYQFTRNADHALNRMDQESIETWVRHAMDLYDTKGLLPALRVLQEVELYARDLRARVNGVTLEDSITVLERFVCGLNGRELRIIPGETTYTDTQYLYLPAFITRFEERDANFQLLKAKAIHQWAQNWYGTWRGDRLLDLAERLAEEQNALYWLHALERLRLDACIERDFPGLFRVMRGLARQAGDDLDWLEDFPQLRRHGATLADSLALLPQLQRREPPQRCCYQGQLRPELVAKARYQRMMREKDLFRIGIAQMLHQQRDQLEPAQEAAMSDEDKELLEKSRERLSLKEMEDQAMPDGFSYQIMLDGKPVVPPEDVQSLMESIIQDLGEIPEEYLVAAGPGLFKRYHRSNPDEDEQVWSGAFNERNMLYYNEWDYKREAHRKNWCTLREMEIKPEATDFYRATLGKYGGLIKSLRRSFEVLRGDDRRHRRQPFGDEVDIDALVEAFADHTSGLEMTDRLFTRLNRDDRDIAVMFMVDMSGSTKGWINEAEREALILLSESLETLGDRYAIYGFSGWSRGRCEIYRVKRFDDPLDETVKGRICAMTAKNYTRMGVAIRHLTSLMDEIDAKVKLLVTISDGKPDDYDDYYRGEYGIEDTRQALMEARRKGVHAYCITIDQEGADYLPHMYGPASFTVLDQVAKLPLKISDIYRKITS